MKRSTPGGACGVVVAGRAGAVVGDGEGAAGALGEAHPPGDPLEAHLGSHSTRSPRRRAGTLREVRKIPIFPLFKNISYDP